MPSATFLSANKCITRYVTFHGRQRGKRSFFGSPLYNVVLGQRSLTNGTKDSASTVNSWRRLSKMPSKGRMTAYKNAVLKLRQTILS
ncbi:hypothetical protein SprV_0200548000 [Sparganum proliferum]